MDKEEEARVRKDMEKAFVKQRAEFDQMGAQLIDIAPVITQFHMALIGGGMTRDEALEVVKTWLSVQLMRRK